MIRKQVKKYAIKYTLEFFVIVLGISISFLINEWNSNKNNMISHKNDLKGLLNDLKNDSLKFNPILIGLEEGKIATQKIVEVSEAFNLKKIDYDELVVELIKVGFPYGYNTFFMTDATYKSLLLDNKINSFPQNIQKKIINYYEFIAKRVVDNNHIVDEICLNYYNKIHPFALYYNNNKGNHSLINNYFKIQSVKDKYKSIDLFIGSSNLLNRIFVYKNQISRFSNQRDDLAKVLKEYSKSIP